MLKSGLCFVGRMYFRFSSFYPIGPLLVPKSCFVCALPVAGAGGVLQVESQTMAPHLLFWKSSELRVQQASGGSISLRRTANIELSKSSELRFTTHYILHYRNPALPCSSPLAPHCPALPRPALLCIIIHCIGWVLGYLGARLVVRLVRLGAWFVIVAAAFDVGCTAHAINFNMYKCIYMMRGIHA